MFSKMKKSSLFIVCLLIFSASFSQRLMINEVSQGTSGSQEYVEFVVVGSPICEGDPIPTIDIRNLIVDDNNGYFFNGSNPGIASGAIKFADTIFWANVPQGTIILLYNNSERNPALPLQDDFSLTDGNCQLVIPVIPNHRLLLGQTVSPTTGNLDYPDDSVWNYGDVEWTPLGMRNAGDSFQILNNPLDGEPFHAVSWGENVSANTIIYFSGSASSRVFSFMNTVSNDFTNQSNWFNGDANTDQTPGLPNSPENSYWIGTMNPSCRALPVISVSANNATCGSSNGSATVDLNSIVGNTQVLWNNGLTSSTISNLDAGVYSVTVIDELGCTFEESVAVSDNNAPVVSSTIVDETCPNSCNGSVTLNVSGGQTPYNFTWSSNVLNSNGNTATSLCSDTYSATITDANGCTANIIETINSSLSFDVITTSTLSSCGASTGSATATVVGGSGNFSYQWGTSAGSQTTQTATNLASGIHQITVTDLTTNCQVSENVLISNQSGLQTSVVKTPTNCANLCNGSATITVNGGTTPYTFLWDSNAGSQTTASVNNLCVGNFTCTVSDNTGCSTMVSVAISGPQAITFTEQITQTSCPNVCDGSLTVSSSGGLAPYTVNVTNDLGNQVGQSNLCTGNYVIMVTDALGCESASKDIIISTSTDIDYTKSPDQLICLDESINITVSTLTSGTTLTWSDGTTTETQSISPLINTNYPFEITSGTCTVKDTIKITVIDCTEDTSMVSLPNIFTPDGDSKNDFYVPLILHNVTVESFVILNRWGNVMVEFKDNNIKWDGKTDGKDASDGTYFYIMNYKDLTSTSFQQHGFIQLIRK